MDWLEKSRKGGSGQNETTESTVKHCYYILAVHGTPLNSMRWNEVVKLLSEIWRIKSTAPQASDHQKAEQYAADAQDLLQENMVKRTKKGSVRGVFTGRSPRQAALKAGNRGQTDIKLRERVQVDKPKSAPAWMPDKIRKPMVKKVGTEKLEGL